jgi:hypothetical protein
LQKSSKTGPSAERAHQQSEAAGIEPEPRIGRHEGLHIDCEHPGHNHRQQGNPHRHIIVLEKSLIVLHAEVMEGRKVFGNPITHKSVI